MTVVPAQQHAMPTEHFAGAVTGLGITEVERRMVSNVQVRALLQTQVAELLAAADTFSQLGHHDRAHQTQAEADVLRRYLLAPE